jgi:type 2 lantibiotic biosynthesis protein LanM
MRRGGLLELFETHPVLARLLARSVEQWTSAAVSLCQRFLRDFSELRTFFGWKAVEPEGAVAHLRTDLSDRHHGGQTVVECVLQTGERVIYKPRTVRPEIAFYKFLGWLNDCGLSLDLRVIRALDRHTHGWVESVASVPCHSDVEVERFYTRAGMLLGVLHALAATDIHCENFIASGEHPVVVDLEMLLNDGASESQQAPGEDEAEDRFGGEPSVSSTGLLPRWQTAPDGHQFDLSALGGDEAQDAGIRLLTWQSINTDQMILTEDTGTAAPMTHRVRLGDKSPSVWDHMSAFREGFREVYSCLLANRQRLISDDRLSDEFDDLELRILVRSTATYTRLHLHLLHPEFLKDGIDRSIELEWLARPLSGTTSPQKGRISVYEHERTAMESLDIPHFGTSAWRDMEHTSDDEDLFLLCGERDSRVLRRRLTTLSQADCSRQLAMMEEAVRSRFERGRADSLRQQDA